MSMILVIPIDHHFKIIKENTNEMEYLGYYATQEQEKYIDDYYDQKRYEIQMQLSNEY